MEEVRASLGHLGLRREAVGAKIITDNLGRLVVALRGTTLL